MGIEFVYDTGASLSTGEGKGNRQEPFVLEPGEVVLEVRGHQGGLLDGVQFISSLGRESKLYGGKGGDPFIVKASVGKMIIGLERSKGICGRIKVVQECDIEDRRSPEEKKRDQMRASYE